MSLAVAKAVFEYKTNGEDLEKAAVRYMQEYGRPYPSCGFGGNFLFWIYKDDPKPYNSFGNGAAMRVSACAYAANSLAEAISMSDAVTRVSHNHPEGMKGAEAVTAAIYLAKTGSSIDDIRKHITENYYPLDFTIDDIRSSYDFNETCQGTVPEAIEAFWNPIHLRMLYVSLFQLEAIVILWLLLLAVLPKPIMECRNKCIKRHLLILMNDLCRFL